MSCICTSISIEQHFLNRIAPNLELSFQKRLEATTQMQKEIEDLLRCYLQETKRETDLVQEILSALSYGSAAKNRVMETIGIAVERASPQRVSTAKAHVVNEDSIAAAIENLRAAHASANVH